MEIVLALAIGAAFGFTLDRIGATDPNIISGMLSLKALHLMKTILMGIGFASVLTFGGQMAGLVEVGHMSVKGAYMGVLIGGLLLGFGWALSGYCPGTGVCAAATGRVDAMVFVLGGLAGAFAYLLSYPWFRENGLLEPILGGPSTLGAIPGTEYPALFPTVSGDLLGIVMGLVFMLVAFILPLRPMGGGAHAPQPAE